MVERAHMLPNHVSLKVTAYFIVESNHFALTRCKGTWEIYYPLGSHFPAEILHKEMVHIF